jgi:hypothetical protein
LIVSSPGKRANGNPIYESSGAVYGYRVKDQSLKFSLESTEAQSKFGLSLAYNPERNLLAVGAPSRDYGYYMYHAGAVYIYDLSSTNLTFANTKTMLYSSDRAARFGKRLEWVGSEDLVVSAPSYTTYESEKVSNEQGMVYFMRGAANLNGDYSTFWAAEVFYTNEAGCRHGDTLHYSSKSSKMIVGSPFCHNYNSEGLNEQRIAGRLYFFNVILPQAKKEEKLFLA